MKQEVKYIQVEYNGLKAGTLVMRAEPTTAHHQARAMVGVQCPGEYYRAIGDDEVHWIPSFKGIVDNHHPLDPRNSAPAHIIKIHFGEDTLPGIKGVKWSVDRSNWPFCILTVCIDTRLTVEERYSVLYSIMKEIENDNSVIVAKKLLHTEFNKVLDPMEEKLKPLEEFKVIIKKILINILKSWGEEDEANILAEERNLSKALCRTGRRFVSGVGLEALEEHLLDLFSDEIDFLAIRYSDWIKQHIAEENSNVARLINLAVSDFKSHNPVAAIERLLNILDDSDYLEIILADQAFIEENWMEVYNFHAAVNWVRFEGMSDSIIPDAKGLKRLMGIIKENTRLVEINRKILKAGPQRDKVKR